MRKHRIYGIVMLFLGLAIVYSCSNNKKSETAAAENKEATAGKDDILTGEMSVIVDEAIYPIMLEQVDVFKDSYVNSKINLIPLPEREAINALLRGEASLAVLARELSKEESVGFKHRSISPRIYPVFYDGVVFVNNIAEADTSMDIKTLSSLLTGESKAKSLVFDNANSSSLRRVKELTKIEKVSGVSVIGLKNSQEVFDYLLKNTNAIGAVSYGQYLEYRRKFGEENKIRILSLQNDSKDGKGGYFKPSQSTFATNEYPLKSEFFVLNYQPNLGLGIGFSAFLTGDRGQRIVLKSGLLPATMPGREIIIRDNIN
ncbi:phosphate ABC transporter [Sphingobacterium sp. DK4209]|uniref:Phosphate ABC transporter n=1 Tax=Sphingobacterium zhuxiongii TaxID=2662364 RepID=A0A5Q0QJ28_9SPHI|nr:MULTISPECIES: substrate-binding domain-containing protein [unclassified Sphingobacterium]MVZ66778.1 phosphate ABC transporter [Sphingobacterium sp. DK4209]QGA28012.1 phosphate ABC transporter [Sphingobacterium sp. dk4302]